VNVRLARREPLAHDTPTMASKAPRGRVKLLSERPLEVQEASGVAPLGDGKFLVIDDEAGVFFCRQGVGPVPLEAGRALSDLEGICMAEDGVTVYLLVERDGSVWRYQWQQDRLVGPHRMGKLPALSGKKNQGWEGIAFAPAGTVSDRELLVTAHQVGPRRIGLFCSKTLEQRALLRLPKSARKALGELNDLTIDLPGGEGHMLILSGKAGRIAELAFDGQRLELVRVYRIETAKNDVPEGIAMAGPGRVWVVTDGEGMLRHLELRKR